jgi:hypothetical protein
VPAPLGVIVVNDGEDDDDDSGGCPNRDASASETDRDELSDSERYVLDVPGLDERPIMDAKTPLRDGRDPQFHSDDHRSPLLQPAEDITWSF